MGTMSWRGRADWLAATASSSPLLSRITGRLSDLRLPRPLLVRLIRAYAKVFAVDLSEATSPIEGFATFNEFFTRRLAEGRRKVAREEGTVVSPSDSLLTVIGPMPRDGRLEQVKGSSYSLEALLGSTEEARPFATGVQATLYLSPGMYHRVHSPVDGRVSAWRYLPGRLFTVNRIGVRAVPGLFTRNERVCVFLETEAHGPVAVVLVGAANVGRISLAFSELVTNRGAAGGRFTPSEPIVLRRGDDLGVFNLGSTVVLLVADPALAPQAAAGELVRMGQPLWGRASK
jgi:phosphatidylserine decarboxylase